MKKIFGFPWIILLAAALPASLAQAQDSPSQRIDALVEFAYKAHKVTPNKPASDETFCRRVYLDIIGRIPNKEELDQFLNNREPGKRAKLIDQLLDSEGYLSHTYNWWADILRVQSDMRNEAGAAYADWIKDSIRSNKPYDQFVRDLVTAKGYIWENGAVGYYMRDAGMPLDNMSNTAQVFLGTRVVCAQCHNHPFDKWKQKDYYEMAAFTYGVDTEMRRDAINPKIAEELYGKEGRKGRGKGKNVKADVRKVEEMIDEILEPLSYGVSEQKRELKLPGDYKYDDAKPNDPIMKAKALFAPDRIDKDGPAIKVDGDMREDLAKWLCDKQNPRFTMVMANRLWKRAFGIGLIEPVDDFKDDTMASNQPLMKFLSEEFARQKYDIKKFQRMLFNTRTYQRECTTTDVSMEAPYYFPGPVLRRMSAEQIWDSIVTLMMPEPDLRRRASGGAERLGKMKSAAEELKQRFGRESGAKGARELITIATRMAQESASYDAQVAVVQRKLTEAREKKDEPKVKELQAELRKKNQERMTAVYKAQAMAEKAIDEKSSDDLFGDKPMAMTARKESTPVSRMDQKADPLAGKTAIDYSPYGDAYFRASELPSPAPSGHFLREFGQADRNVIENSWNDASVTQALSLMNGKIFEELTSQKSILAKTMEYALTPTEKARNLWLAVLGRMPSAEEQKLVTEFSGKSKDSWKDIFWALLNGREFLFIQ